MIFFFFLNIILCSMNSYIKVKKKNERAKKKKLKIKLVFKKKN